MIGLYVGMFLIGLGSVLCLWEAIRQWCKGEALASREEFVDSLHENRQRKPPIREAEEKHRAYALCCLVASIILALIDIIVGGIVWACGG